MTDTDATIRDADGFPAVMLAVYESCIFPGTFYIGCHNSGVHLRAPSQPGSPPLNFTNRADAEAALRSYRAQFGC